MAETKLEERVELCLQDIEFVTGVELGQYRPAAGAVVKAYLKTEARKQRHADAETVATMSRCAVSLPAQDAVWKGEAHQAIMNTDLS